MYIGILDTVALWRSSAKFIVCFPRQKRLDPDFLLSVYLREREKREGRKERKERAEVMGNGGRTNITRAVYDDRFTL